LGVMLRDVQIIFHTQNNTLFSEAGPCLERTKKSRPVKGG
jgi:hypothetical protein